MNARLYDPLLGRFITPDSRIEGPAGQGLNRYSYVRNNPLSLTDPTGNWSLKKNLKALARWIATPSIKNTFELVRAMPGQKQIDKLIMSNKTLYAVGQWVSTAFTAFCGGCGGAAYSAYYGYVATGSVNAGLRMGARAYVSNYLSQGVGEYYGNTWSAERVFTGSVIGGVASEINGGKFSDGFRASFATSTLTYAAVSMRAAMIEQSKINSANKRGESVGFNGDKFKLGGGRWVEGLPMNEQVLSSLGGLQGGPGSLFGADYAPGSWQDYLVEAYAGPHDYLNSGYWYNTSGNAINYTGLGAAFGEALNAANVVVATPFVVSSVIQPYTYMFVQR